VWSGRRSSSRRAEPDPAQGAAQPSTLRVPGTAQQEDRQNAGAR
jgi:hypothetical protein